MPFTVTEYYYKTSDQSWNPGANTSGQNTAVDSAIAIWKSNTVEKQPGFISYVPVSYPDENTEKRGWVIDDYFNAKDFYTNIHSANDANYTNMKTAITSNSNNFVHHTLKVSLTDPNGVETFIIQPNTK
jgi:hypothetical protein